MVISEQIPQTAGIIHALPKVDFSDTFSTTNHRHSLYEIGNLIFNDPPGWIVILFRVRNFIVQFLGLKTTMPQDYHKRFEVGGYIGFFKIHEIREDELLLGANDKHLDFRVSIYNSGAELFNIKVTTLVKNNNTLGKFYMWVVKPFHRLVVRKMVENAFHPAYEDRFSEEQK